MRLRGYFVAAGFLSPSNDGDEEGSKPSPPPPPLMLLAPFGVIDDEIVLVLVLTVTAEGVSFNVVSGMDK